MSACKCGHLPAAHVGGAGLCTDAKCDCDRYVQRSPVISTEARTLATNLAGTQNVGGRERVANAFQDLIDQRDSWQREAAKLLAQRDYAERRANEVEGRHAALLEQLRAVLARFDAGAVR